MTFLGDRTFVLYLLLAISRIRPTNETVQSECTRDDMYFYDNMCFMRINYAMQGHANAEAYCMNDLGKLTGGRLALLYSTRRDEIYDKLLDASSDAPANTKYLVGGYQPDNSVEPLGGWVWKFPLKSTSHSPIDSSAWTTGASAPDDNSQEQCAYMTMSRSGSKLHTNTCNPTNAITGFICEFTAVLANAAAPSSPAAVSSELQAACDAASESNFAFDGSCFLMSSVIKSHAGAEAACTDDKSPLLNGRLAYLNTLERLTAFTLQNYDSKFHVGLVQMDTSSEPAGNWVWSSPSGAAETPAEMTRDRWVGNRPNIENSDKSCGIVMPVGLLQEKYCGLGERFICEFDTALTTTTSTTTSTTTTTITTSSTPPATVTTTVAATTTAVPSTTTVFSQPPGFFGLTETEDVVATVSQPANMADAQVFGFYATSEQSRTTASWDWSRFQWLTFEGRPLLPQSELYRWNDKALGNCFTFNHVNLSKVHQKRRVGRGSGLLVYVDIAQHDYLPWVTSAGMRVFVHDRFVPVAMETPSFTAAPGFYTHISARNIDYERLSEPHSNCVEHAKEVRSYYAKGNYTANLCVRSCYQDELMLSECACMDPRFDSDPQAPICSLKKRECIDKFMMTNSDPDKWKGCECPLPCRSTDYFTQQSRARFAFKRAKCGGNSSCNGDEHSNRLIIEVYMNSLSHLKYVETADMSFVDFLAGIGGCLGIVCGMSVISMTEIIVSAVRYFATLGGLFSTFFRVGDPNSILAYRHE